MLISSDMEDAQAAARQQLNDSGQLYRALFSATQEGLLVVNDEGRYVQVNEAYARLLKTSPEHLIGRHFTEFMPAERLAEAVDAFRQLTTNGQGLSEFPLRAVDGTLVDCEWTVHSHFLPGLSLCSARDVGRRKAAEEALKANEARLRFLTALDDATRPLTEPEQIVKTAACLLGEYLAVDSVGYGRFDPDQEHFQITGDYNRGNAPHIVGDYGLNQFGPALGAALRANRTFTVDDIAADPQTAGEHAQFLAMGMRAVLAVPLHKSGRLVAAMGARQLAPRKWRDTEIELLRLVANRCWESMERARVTAELRRQTHTFDALLSNLPDLICTFDLNGRFTYANPALLNVWQKSLPDVVGKNTFELGYPPELAARLQQEVQTVIETQKPVRNITPFSGAAGETRVYEYIFSPVLGDYLLEAVTCTARDITDRERMENELAASRQRLEQLLAQAPVAIIMLYGRDLVIELANPFFHKLVRYRKLVGLPLAQAVPELGEPVFAAIERAMQTGAPFAATDWLIAYAEEGKAIVEDHWFNVVYHPIHDAGGQFNRMVVLCYEVTSQVVARKELERANRELEEFAFVASHDLQEPLRMVAIYTEILLNRYLPDNPKAREYGGFVRQGVNRMEELIHDLLAYSRIIHTENDPAGRADLNESLAAAVKTLESRIRETHASIQAAPLPVVRGETSQLVHLFQNLLSNSLKYHRANIAPEILISARRDGEFWTIAVADNGIGFEPQYAQRIFGLFKRLHKDEYAGTGLGLAICQRIVERYGGRIWGEGFPGQGATFYITLPAAD